MSNRRENKGAAAAEHADLADQVDASATTASGEADLKPNASDEAAAENAAAEKIEIEVAAPLDDAEGGPAAEQGSWEDQLRDAENRALRAQAELENFRRRARREIEDERRFAAQPLLVDLFPVVDNLDRAIDAAGGSAEASSLLEGVQMVRRQLLDVLEKNQCRRIEAAGQPFDPALHEAISQQPSEEYEQGHVTLVAQHGYQLHDRVVRPAQVIVSTGPPSA